MRCCPKLGTLALLGPPPAIVEELPVLAGADAWMGTQNVRAKKGGGTGEPGRDPAVAPKGRNGSCSGPGKWHQRTNIFPAAKMIGSPSFSRVWGPAAMGGSALPITCHPSFRQSLSLAAASRIPHPTPLLCWGTMELPAPPHAHSWGQQRPGHRDVHGSRYGQGAGLSKAEHPRELGKKLPPPPASSSGSQWDQPPPGCFLNSVHLPACRVPHPSQAAEAAASRERRWLLGWVCSLASEHGMPGVQREGLGRLRLPLCHPVPLGDVTPMQAMCSSRPSPPSPGWKRGRSEVTLAARKGKLKGEAERDGACPLSPLWVGSATEMNERLACIAPGPPAGRAPFVRGPAPSLPPGANPGGCP